MPVYECTYCGFSTKLKTDYKRHLSTKKHISIVKNLEELSSHSNDINENEPKRAKMSQCPKIDEPKRAKMSQNQDPQCNEVFACMYCKKIFKTKANLRRHELHRCKINKQNEKMLLLKLETEKDEKQKLYNQIEELLEQNGKIIQNTIINDNRKTINNIHQTNNIVVNNFGDEDLSHLTNSVLDRLISSPANMINNLTKLIHFNKNKPENMNMYIPNKKQKHIKIFKGNKWTYEAKSKRIPDIIDRNYLILDSHYEDCGGNERIDKVSNENYKNFQKLYDDDNEQILKQEKETCEYEILNNSKTVMDQHNLHKFNEN